MGANARLVPAALRALSPYDWPRVPLRWDSNVIFIKPNAPEEGHHRAPRWTCMRSWTGSLRAQLDYLQCAHTHRVCDAQACDVSA